MKKATANTSLEIMQELTPQEATEILDYITQLVVGEYKPECPVEAINKLSEISEQEN